MTTCIINPYVKKSILIFLQVLIISIFLNIFFFNYVSFIEKISFENQINIIVDDFMEDFKIADRNLTYNQKLSIMASLDYANNKNTFESKNILDKIKNNNKKLKTKAFEKINYAIIIFVIFLILIYLLNYCLGLSDIVIETVYVLLAVAITEFLFLNLIAKNYETINYNIVKEKVYKKLESLIKT